MDPALQHHVALGLGGDADRGEGGQVVRLHVVRDDHDLHRAGVEHRARTHVVQLAARHRSAVAEAPVAKEADAPGHPARHARQIDRRHVELAAEPERDLGADARLDHLLHRLGIEDRERGHVLETGVEDRAEHRHRVHRSAGGAVVAVVEQHHRAAAGRLGIGERAGARHRRGERLDLVDERRALGPGQVEQLVAPAPRQGRIAVGHDHGRQAREFDVGVRKADEDAGAERALGLHRPAARLQLPVRRIVAALAHHVRQHRPAAPGYGRARPARPAGRARARPARSPVSCMSTCG